MQVSLGKKSTAASVKKSTAVAVKNPTNSKPEVVKTSDDWGWGDEWAAPNEGLSSFHIYSLIRFQILNLNCQESFLVHIVSKST